MIGLASRVPAWAVCFGLLTLLCGSSGGCASPSTALTIPFGATVVVPVAIGEESMFIVGSPTSEGNDALSSAVEFRVSVLGSPSIRINLALVERPDGVASSVPEDSDTAVERDQTQAAAPQGSTRSLLDTEKVILAAQRSQKHHTEIRLAVAQGAPQRAPALGELQRPSEIFVAVTVERLVLFGLLPESVVGFVGACTIVVVGVVTLVVPVVLRALESVASG